MSNDRRIISFFISCSHEDCPYARSLRWDHFDPSHDDWLLVTWCLIVLLARTTRDFNHFRFFQKQMCLFMIRSIVWDRLMYVVDTGFLLMALSATYAALRGRSGYLVMV